MTNHQAPVVPKKTSWTSCAGLLIICEHTKRCMEPALRIVEH